jgi:hypothetical protein
MLSGNTCIKFVLNAALACLVVFIGIAVAIKAIAKQSKSDHAQIVMQSSTSQAISPPQ